MGEFPIRKAAAKMVKPPRSRRDLSARRLNESRFFGQQRFARSRRTVSKRARTCQSGSVHKCDVRVFGIRDEQSAVDLQEWRPLSVQTFRPRLRAWGYSNQLVPAMLDADLDILSIHGLWKYCSVASHRWHRRTGRPYHRSSARNVGTMGLAKRAVGRNESPRLLYENQHLRGAACLRALSEAEARSIRAYGLRNPICVIPNGVDLPDLSDEQCESSGRRIEKLSFISADFTGRKIWQI